MHTISELNNKWWYRLIKVGYLLLIMAACVISIAVAFEDVGTYQTDYLVVCNYGNKSTFIANKDKDIWNIPQYYDYSESLAKLPDSTKIQLQSACGISQAEMNAKFENPNDNKKLFDLTETKVNTTSYWSAILWSILSIIITFAIAEIIRRIFYYIVLGKVKPVK
ncbi:MAG: hypothetical protein HYW77_00690 [Parcubacteria group bacterium]|nr:hypothetical protein [Parcubacteria group bacterium]